MSTMSNTFLIYSYPSTQRFISDRTLVLSGSPVAHIANTLY
jgi:hypothetical protein